MSKVIKKFVGIDISKPYFDASALKAEDPKQIVHKQFSQNVSGYKQFLVWLKQQGISTDQETLFCMEFTGVYTIALAEFLAAKQALLWVEMPLRIKKSEGFQRGGDDKSASAKIALYAYRHQDSMQLWKPLDSSIQRIKNYLAQRDRLMGAINSIRTPINEMKECGLEQEAREMEKIQRQSIHSMEQAIEKIEVRIMELVNADSEIKKKVAIASSIKGVGPITALSFLVYTKGFTSFNNAKELACYCGVAPFNKSSGISIRFRPSVSPFANKKLKKLLHMCALSAIRYNDEIKSYYERKVAEGKNKMSVINAVRNKLVHRMFALVTQERMYEENYMRKCA